jgi:DNA-binding PadR family transcriptional regulator
MALKKLKAVIQLFIEALEKLGIANVNVEKSQKESVKIQEDNEAWREEMRKENEAWREEFDKNVGEAIADIKKTVHQILEVEELACENDANLVGNGTAKKISEVIHQ